MKCKVAMILFFWGGKFIFIKQKEKNFDYGVDYSKNTDPKCEFLSNEP